MKLYKELEKKVEVEAKKYLEKGRPDWDVPHTEAAVFWMKKLIETEGGNEKVLITAIWLHDIGNPQYKKGYDFEDMKKCKKEVPHHEIGAAEAPKVLDRIGGFTEVEITEISKLIRGHYDKKNIDTFHQQLIVEADGLAKIDWDRVNPNWSREDCENWIENYYKPRTASVFKTTTGKKYLEKLLKKTEHYWD